MTSFDAHALSIGVSLYQHAKPLRATRDAEAIAELLADPTASAYPSRNVKLLLDGAATREAILGELDALAERVKPSSTVFLYFSGHGSRAATSEGTSYFLLPVDAQPSSRAELERTAISSGELTARLARISAARLTVVLDCCRAAELSEADLPLASAELTDEVLSPLSRGRGRAVLAASRADGASYTMPHDEHSVFTKHLLRGLRGSATSVGGVIRVCDLFHYAQQATVEELPMQRPVFRAELEENFSVALCPSAALTPLPAPPDDKRYDAFIVFAKKSPADRQWVRRVLVPMLERRGLRLFLEERDSRLGESRLEVTERAIAESRYQVLVLTPELLASGVEDYQALLAAYAAASSRLPSFIPVMRAPCELQLHRNMTAMLDATEEEEVPAALERLAFGLRQAPRPRLSK